ncbi:MAG: hypothetical protein JSV98_05990 [candidate division WOR-3 bacterium]|nr:MAG: hypothetical protein JSV98_05990 [candidate division WOR-3 bacterium]
MNKIITLIVTIVVLIAIVSCTRRDEFDLLHNGDFSIVTKGSYRGRLLFLGDGREHRETVEYLRGLVEQNFDVLDLISERFYTISHMGYKFKYAALDEEAEIMMLRYFARIREHPVYAGYQIQFLFDSRSRKLKSIYTEEVPLE